MNKKEARWRQRYQVLKKAYFQLQDAVEAFDKLNVLEKEGMIQRFEYTFELAWKTLKDYLESQEVRVSFPREVIKKAFYYGLIENGETWMEMLEKRSLLAHTYNEDQFNLAVNKVKNEFFIAITQVYETLGGKK